MNKEQLENFYLGQIERLQRDREKSWEMYERKIRGLSLHNVANLFRSFEKECESDSELEGKRDRVDRNYQEQIQSLIEEIRKLSN